MHLTKALVTSGTLLASNVLAIDLDLEDASSVRDAAKIVAASVVDRYQNGSKSTGLFSDPYYFWEAGLAWDSLIHYWYQTGDDAYNDIIGAALVHQMDSPNNAYEPVNQTKSLGNDDQSTWALAAMTAAEYGFPSDVLDVLNTTWADTAINVFERQAARWDEQSCQGGLRWQIFAFNAGFNYKNAQTNGNFYQLARRLAAFTGNATYNDWAERVLDWSFEIGLITGENSASPGVVYDGAGAERNCSQLNHLQWTASTGTYLAGAAYDSTDNHPRMRYMLIDAIKQIFASGNTEGYTNGTLFEIACEVLDNCNVDQLAFKAVLARALTQTRDLASDAQDLQGQIEFILRQSAKGAAAQCSGGANGTTCGSNWGSSEWDGSYGLGQDLSALNVILGNIPRTEPLRVSNSTSAGGGSSGNSTNSTTTGGADDTDAGAGAVDSATESTGAASHIAVSSLVLMAAVGSMMVFL